MPGNQREDRDVKDNRNFESRNFEPRRDHRDRDHRDKENRVPAHVRVTVNRDEPIEKVIRKFKKLCEKAGIKKELKARRYYEKPSEARRREVRKKERNRRKAEKKLTDQRKHPKGKLKPENEF